MSQDRGEEEIEDLTAKFQNRQVETTGSSSDFGEKPKSSSNFVSNMKLNNILEGQDMFNKQILETLRIMRNEMKEGMDTMVEKIHDKQEKDTKEVMNKLQAIQNEVDKLKESKGKQEEAHENLLEKLERIQNDIDKLKESSQKRDDVSKNLIEKVDQLKQDQEMFKNKFVRSSQQSVSLTKNVIEKKQEESREKRYVPEHSHAQEVIIPSKINTNAHKLSKVGSNHGRSDNNDDCEKCQISVIDDTDKLLEKPKNDEKNAPYTIKFEVYTIPPGKRFTIEMKSSDTVFALKTKINEETNAPINQLRVTIDVKVCENSETLQKCGLPPGSFFMHLNFTNELDAVHPKPSHLRVIVKTLTGKQFSVDILSTQTVLDLKDKIEDIEGIPNDQQRLIFKGKQMEDGKALEDYGVENESVLHLILRLRG